MISQPVRAFERGRQEMARTVATLPAGSRITDYISLGVIAKTFPMSKIHAVLAATNRASIRERDLPAHVVVYYVIALALYMQSSYREVLRCLLEGVQWLLDPSATVKVAGKSGISQARTRLGWESMRRLHDEVVKPIAVRATRGAWYRQWHLISVDGSTLDVADEAANEQAFGRPGASRGSSAYPQIRFVSLVESGTHVLFGSQMAPYGTGEITLAKAVLGNLQPGMLCLADRQSSASRCGTKRARPGLICCGGSRRTCAWRVKSAYPMALISATSIHPNVIGGESPTACRCASSTIVCRTSPMPSRSTGSSPPFWITRKPPPQNWPPSTMSAGKSKRRWMN
jgi:Insertion element 4 transposase N-terminal